MKNRILFAFGIVLTCILSGCVKDLQKAGISETTILKGRILEESSRVPIPQVKVKVTNGETDYYSTTSGNDGVFNLEVDFDKVDKNSYVFLEMQNGYSEITKQIELKGMGKEISDYGDLFLLKPIFNDWLYYGDGEVVDYWGLINGGDDEWGIMFPSNNLLPYVGTSITKVRVYIDVPGRYYLKFYEGGNTSPTSLKLSMYYDINDVGWNVLLVNPGLSFNTSTNLWVSLSFSYESGQYPRVAGDGINEPNARWARSNGSAWHDAYDHNGGEDLCWIIQVYVTNGSKGVEEEYELPLNITPIDYSEVSASSSTPMGVKTMQKTVNTNRRKAK